MDMKLLINSSLLVLALCMSGCDNTATFNTQDKTKTNITRAYSGKPVAPVQLEYQVLGEPQSGVPLSISLTITPAVAANTVSINLYTSSELIIVDGTSILELNNLAAGQAVTRNIRVIPQADGRHHLRINTYIDSASGRSGTRSFSISFTAGNIDKATDLPNAATIQPVPNGENLIIQKGVETRTLQQ
jgi:hypothetical protein